MSGRVWLLPSRPDPEAAAIAALLRKPRIPDGSGGDVAESWDAATVQSIRHSGGSIYAIEREDWPAWAAGPETDCAAAVVRIDHHAPGDPGYGRPPDEFLPASSIGQVVSDLARSTTVAAGWEPHGYAPDEYAPELAYPSPGEIRLIDPGWAVHSPAIGWRLVPREIVMVAAADHCLGAAYRGECPGVDPEALMRWRVASRAAHQGRSVDAVLADIAAARVRLRAAPHIPLQSPSTGPIAGICDGYCGEGPHEHPDAAFFVADLRGAEIPELPEAACREGIAFLATPRPTERDPRRKVVLQCATAEQLAAWPTWAAANGITDLYGGDPMRGFAGGYLPTVAASGAEAEP